MFSPLKHPEFRKLFLAQVIALVGTGLATIALGLLAFEIDEDKSSWILGLILTVKMLAYVIVAPLSSGLSAKFSRKTTLILLDIIRAVLICLLPLASQTWQVLTIILVLQSASAAFTPAFQATIPDLLTDEEEYTHALSLSRLVYDLESLLSPLLAALCLLVVSYKWLFACTVLGFLGSAICVLLATIPEATSTPNTTFIKRTITGLNIYWKTPRLRGLWALSLTVAAVGAMIFVNTVTIVRQDFGLGDNAVAIAFALFGFGSMLVAFASPKLIKTHGDRPVMFSGALILILTLTATAAIAYANLLNMPWLLGLWFLIGAGYSAVVTPTGRLLQRSAHQQDRHAVYAAQFALSHLCWLLAYPLAGGLMTLYSTTGTILCLVALGSLGLILAALSWPREVQIVPHTHPELPENHPHLTTETESPHQHTLIIDDLHPHWPTLALTEYHP